jgi:hypothetical protein
MSTLSLSPRQKTNIFSSFVDLHHLDADPDLDPDPVCPLIYADPEFYFLLICVSGSAKVESWIRILICIVVTSVFCILIFKISGAILSSMLNCLKSSVR